MTTYDILTLGTCPTCEAIPVAYRRHRYCDWEALLLRFKLIVGHEGLIDVVEYSCGCVMWRGGRPALEQKLGERGYQELGMDSSWKVKVPCGEAERVVRELREAKAGMDHRYRNTHTVILVAPTFKQAKMVAKDFQSFMGEKVHTAILSRPENLMGSMLPLMLIVFRHEDMTADQKAVLRDCLTSCPEWIVVYMNDRPGDNFEKVKE